MWKDTLEFIQKVLVFSVIEKMELKQAILLWNILVKFINLGIGMRNKMY